MGSIQRPLTRVNVSPTANRGPDRPLHIGIGPLCFGCFAVQSVALSTSLRTASNASKRRPQHADHRGGVPALKPVEALAVADHEVDDMVGWSFVF